MAPTLLTLPMELQLKILRYLLVVGEPVYEKGASKISCHKIFSEELKVQSVTDQRWIDGRLVVSEAAQLDFKSYKHYGYNIRQPPFELQSVEASSQLLATCKALFEIGRPMLYGCNTIVLAHISDIIGLKSLVGPANLSQIKSLKLNTFLLVKTSYIWDGLEPYSFERWTSTQLESGIRALSLNVLRSMPRLKSITVEILPNMPFFEPNAVASCVEHLRRLLRFDTSESPRFPSWFHDAVMQTTSRGVEWSVHAMWIDTSCRRLRELRSYVSIATPSYKEGEEGSDTNIQCFDGLVRISCTISRPASGENNQIQANEPAVNPKTGGMVAVEERRIVGGSWSEWEVVKEMDCSGRD